MNPNRRVSYLTTDQTGGDWVYQPEALHNDEVLDVKAIVDRIELCPYEEDAEKQGWFYVSESEHSRILDKINGSSSDESHVPSTSEGDLSEGASEDAEVVKQVSRAAKQGMLAGVPVRRAAGFVSGRGGGRSGRGRGTSNMRSSKRGAKRKAL